MGVRVPPHPWYDVLMRRTAQLFDAWQDLVHTASIPAYLTVPPRVLLYEDRVYLRVPRHDTDTTLVYIEVDHLVVPSKRTLAERAMQLLKDDARRTTPKERFQRMVDRGLICPQGCVLAYGAYQCDPARHAGEEATP